MWAAAVCDSGALGAGFGDDVLDGLGNMPGVAAKFAPLIPLFL